MANANLQSLLDMFLMLLMIGYWGYSPGQAESNACPSGFLLVNTTCYYFSERRTTASRAQTACESVSANLASLSTAEEDVSVRAYILSLGGDVDYWIGITQHNALQFEWVDGSPLESTYWGDEFDPNNERTNCIRMDGAYKWHWHDKSCASSFNFICEGPREDGSCPGLFPLGPVTYGNSCYAITNSSDDRQSYNAAKSMCEAIGGYLVALNTEDERLFIEGQAEYNNYTGVWLGLTQSDYGNYKWISEEPFNYTNYASTPFDDGTDCFILDANEGYKWADLTCARYNYFICEREAYLQEVVKIRQFRVARKDRVPIAQNTLSNESLPNLNRCGSSCISNCNCSSFAYNSMTRDCLLARSLNQADISPGSEFFFLQENTPEDNNKRIFLSDEQGKKLWIADTTKMAFTEIPIAVTFPLKAIYDPAMREVYVAQSSYLLSRAMIDGSMQMWINLTYGVGNSISDLSIDARYRRLYVVLSPPDIIVQYDLNYYSPLPTNFVNTGLGTPRAVHAVSSKGHVYFSHDSTIEQIDCDGSNRMTIYSGSPLTDVLILTVDLDTGKIFMVDNNVENIFSMDLDGTNIMTFLQEAATVRGLSYHAGLLYWTDDDSMLRVSATSSGSTITTEGGFSFADARMISVY